MTYSHLSSYDTIECKERAMMAMLVVAALCSLLTLIAVGVVGGIAGPTLSDASKTLEDVRLIVPKVNASLAILHKLCTSGPLQGKC